MMSHGARVWSVRANISSAAAMYSSAFLRLRQSSSVIFQRRSGSFWRLSKRSSCSSGLICSQNLTMITPSIELVCSK